MTKTTATEPTTTTAIPLTGEDPRDLPARGGRQFVLPQSAALNAQWTISTTNGISISGYRPGWDQSIDPSEQNVDDGYLADRLDSVFHRQWFPGQITDANLGDSTGHSIGRHAILCPQIGVDPFSDDPAKREPTVSVELVEGYDDWIEGLDADGVAALAAKFHAAGDQLLNQVLPALVAAREDWAKNSGQSSATPATT